VPQAVSPILLSFVARNAKLDIRTVTLGPRANSSLYIYLSLPQLLAQDPPIPVFMSTNNVILTPGNADGVIPKELFAKVVRLRRDMSKPVVEKAAEDTATATDAVTAEGDGEQGGTTQPSKRDRKNREKPRFIEEIVWENGAAVDPPRLLDLNVPK
jgi:hypothetical protein